LGELDEGKEETLKCIFRHEYMRAWTEFISPRIRFSGRLLWTDTNVYSGYGENF
jgi:hypothetical protein